MRQDLYITTQKNKGIYGKATIKQVKELSDEGIETQTIPWIEEKETKSYEIELYNSQHHFYLYSKLGLKD